MNTKMNVDSSRHEFLQALTKKARKIDENDTVPTLYIQIYGLCKCVSLWNVNV